MFVINFALSCTPLDRSNDFESNQRICWRYFLNLNLLSDKRFKPPELSAEAQDTQLAVAILL